MPNYTLRGVALDELADARALISDSWHHNPDTPLNYTPEVMASWIRYTRAKPPVARGVFDGERLIAFVAGLPRTFRLHDRDVRLLLMTWFTVDPAYQRQGLGRRVWADCVRQAKLENYDGTLHYCTRGNPSNQITLAGATEAGAHAGHIFDVTFLMRALTPARTDPLQLPVASADSFVRAASDSVNDVPLFRLWTLPEAEWECCSRPGALSVAHNAGDSTGVISGYLMEVADGRGTTCAIVDDVLWGRLEGSERDALAASFLAAVAGRAHLVWAQTSRRGPRYRATRPA